MIKKHIAIVLSLMMLVTGCASKIQESSLIEVSNTEGLPDSLKGVNDARLHARADFHSADGLTRRTLATGAPTYRVQQFADKTDAYIQAYMDEYPKEIKRLGTIRTGKQAVTSLFVGLGIAFIVLAVSM